MVVWGKVLVREKLGYEELGSMYNFSWHFENFVGLRVLDEVQKT